jgi:hypothetical protein
VHITPVITKKYLKKSLRCVNSAHYTHLLCDRQPLSAECEDATKKTAGTIKRSGGCPHPATGEKKNLSENESVVQKDF